MTRVVSSRLFVTGLVVALTGTLLSAVSVTVQAQQEGRDAPPRTAVLARADNPVDALAAGAIAGQIGGIVLLTMPSRLFEEAQEGLQAFDPDLVVLAGGQGALSEQVRADVEALGYEVRRVSGANRFETAAELAALFAELGSAYLEVDETAVEALNAQRLAGHTVEQLAEELGGVALGNVVTVPADGTPEENGAALRDVVEGLTAEASAADDGDAVTAVVLDTGTYDIGDEPIALPFDLVLAGQSRQHTEIVRTGGGDDPESGAVLLAEGFGGEIVVRSLTVRADADGAMHATGIRHPDTTTLRLQDVDVHAQGGTERSAAVHVNTIAHLRDTRLYATGAGDGAQAVGLLSERGNVAANDLVVLVGGAGSDAYGFWAMEENGTGGGTFRLRDVTVSHTANGAGVRIDTTDPVIATYIRDSRIETTSTTATAIQYAASTEVHTSEILAPSAGQAISQVGGQSLRVSRSMIRGDASGEAICAFTHGDNWESLSDSCAQLP